MDIGKMKAELRDDEDDIPYAYQDSLGFWTIGVGHLIDKRRGGGLSKRIRELILDEDIAEKSKDLDARLSWWRSKPETVQRALLNMCFQMGIGKLLGFVNSLRLIELNKFKEAGPQMRQSLWYTQTPNRAERVIKMIEGA
jgi:lysozyme